jgi:2-iminobutanoate/2-iminopropanoate deaminase
MKQCIVSTNAPAPIGPYNQATKAGNMLFISGQIALHPESGMLIQESLEQETHQVMANLKAILNEAGTTFDAVMKTTIFLTDMAYFNEVNTVYASYFNGNYPARETVAVAGLPRGVRVEISMIAWTEA